MQGHSQHVLLQLRDSSLIKQSKLTPSLTSRPAKRTAPRRMRGKSGRHDIHKGVYYTLCLRRSEIWKISQQFSFEHSNDRYPGCDLTHIVCFTVMIVFLTQHSTLIPFYKYILMYSTIRILSSYSIHKLIISVWVLALSVQLN